MKKSILFFWVLIPALGFAQPFSVNWFKVAGGGGTSTGDVFTVTGTFGQHDAGGPMAGGGFSVMSGFWSPANSDSYFNPTGTAPVINSGPQLVLLTTSAAVINVSVSGTDPIFYQWKKGALNLKDATNSSLNLNLAAAGYNGSYLLIAISPYGSVTSSVVAVPLYSAPSISVQPRTRTNVVGTIASFSVTAGGNPSPNYQWRQSAVIITNATGSNYSFLATNAGTFSYDVVVSNFFGTVVSTAANLVATNGTGPSILVQPQSITNVVGGISTLSLTATGNPALVYQWRFNSAFITNATSSSYSFLATNAGDYDVILTNYYGSLTSSVAVLTLTNGTGPSIFAQPQSRTNLIGTVASFSVSAAGNPAPGYQWRLNSSPVAGATGGTYNFTASASGGYDVVVSNYYGSTTDNQ